MLLKDQFLKKMLLEKKKKKIYKMSAFFRKTIGSDNSFTLIENNFKFLTKDSEV